MMNLSKKLKHVAAGSAVALMSLPVLADDLATTATTELAGAKDAVNSVGAVVIGVAAAIVMVGLIIKVMRK